MKINNEVVKKVPNYLNLIYIILYLVSCLFMYNMYKCLSGFVANNFEDGLFMLTPVISYALPVICFFFFFYNNMVKEISKVGKIVYSSIVIGISVFCIVGIGINFNAYATNNALGVYEAIPSIGFAFPYDQLVVQSFLIICQIINLVLLFKPTNDLLVLQEAFKKRDYFKFNIFEYIAICLYSVFVLVFFGSALCGLNSLENALYNPKYIYLILWLLIIPTMDLMFIVFKPHIRNLKKRNEIILYSVGISLNVLFGLLLAIFEVTDPSFVVQVGKPLFPITFSVSLPIEIIIILLLSFISIVISVIHLIKRILKKEEKEIENSVENEEITAEP